MSAIGAAEARMTNSRQGLSGIIVESSCAESVGGTIAAQSHQALRNTGAEKHGGTALRLSHPNFHSRHQLRFSLSYSPARYAFACSTTAGSLPTWITFRSAAANSSLFGRVRKRWCASSTTDSHAAWLNAASSRYGSSQRRLSMVRTADMRL